MNCLGQLRVLRLQFLRSGEPDPDIISVFGKDAAAAVEPNLTGQLGYAPSPSLFSLLAPLSDFIDAPSGKARHMGRDIRHIQATTSTSEPLHPAGSSCLLRCPGFFRAKAGLDLRREGC